MYFNTNQKKYFLKVFRCVGFLYNIVLKRQDRFLLKKISKILLLVQININKSFYC
ncbi:transposase [Borreliella burgdorferi]|uniref:transposase n=1 Tax=Borreliella burgdorferi TaxID=139 RepID=UPI001E507393|nr:transposase [Borreliella burgdorferi]MCD2413621.1 transposase [Borreliella burgdorferi]